MREENSLRFSENTLVSHQGRTLISFEAWAYTDVMGL